MLFVVEATACVPKATTQILLVVSFSLLITQTCITENLLIYKAVGLRNYDKLIIMAKNNTVL